MYEQIKNDPEIIEIYNRINEFENSDNAWARHDYKHVLNVVNIIEQVLLELNYSKDLIEEAKIAAILHDIGATIGKEGHAEKSYEFAKDYIDRKDIKLKYKDDVLEAIKIHSDGFDTDNIIALVLIFADKLDITKDRVAEYGYQVIGMRQIAYINDINISIDSSQLTVRFNADDEIDVQELTDFYFMHKVVKSVFSFAEKINLIPKIYLNNQTLNIINDSLELIKS